MSAGLIVRRGGPHLTVQDLGRPGHLDHGLSRGGAADVLAQYEGAALLGQRPGCAAVEMAGHGGVFEATEDLTIALTGAPMDAEMGGTALSWNASHVLPRGAVLTIGRAREGVFGYLHVGGGLETLVLLGARSVHLAAGLGRPLETGDRISVGADDVRGATGRQLDVPSRFAGGIVRAVAGLHFESFPEDARAGFADAAFTRDARGNRMGARFLPEGEGFANASGLSVLSEITLPGDIQVTGDGAPVVLLAECQTTGGYPRIGTVIPADLPRVAQTAPGKVIRFAFVARQEALAAERDERARRAALASQTRRLVPGPGGMPDLLSQQLISGVTAGDDLEGNGT